MDDSARLKKLPLLGSVADSQIAGGSCRAMKCVLLESSKSITCKSIRQPGSYACNKSIHVMHGRARGR